MKPILFSALLTLTSLSAEDVKFAELTTTNGKTYVNVTVRKYDASSLSIVHDSGASKIPFEFLPEKVQKDFGYDPVKAEAAKAAAWEALPAEARYSVTPKVGIGCTIHFEDRLALVEKVRRQAADELLSPEQTQAEVDEVPQGGYIRFEIERSTIGAASEDSFVVIVTDAQDKVIIRQAGERDVPEVPIGNGMWWNIFLVPLRVQIPDVMKVRLVDRIGNETADFVIRKNPPP